MILLRWGLLFLVLANTLLFFWFSMQTGQGDRAQNKDAELQRLRLLNEFNAGELRLKQEALLPSAAGGEVADTCYEVSGYSDEPAATGLQQWLHAQQITAYIESERVVLPEQYRLTLPAVISTSERLRLLDQLRRHGLEGQLADMSEMRQTLAVYQNQRRANQAQSLLSLLEVSSEVASVSPFETRSRVLFDAAIDEILFNKIKEIVANSPSELKITKKTCTGVESLKRTE